MADPARRRLLGYAIGALEEPERQQIQRRLQHDPAWQEELAAVRESLEPLEEARRTYRPPAGLAERTCQMVARLAPPAAEPVTARALPQRAGRPGPPRMSPAQVPPSSIPRWSWADLAVGAGIVVALGMLVFPAVQRNRLHARLVACQDCLRQFTMGVAQLEQNHPGLFSSVVRHDAPVDLQPAALPSLAVLIPGQSRPLRELRDLCRPLSALEAQWLGTPRLGHHGISESVWGQNVPFGDGQVRFVPAGPLSPEKTGISPISGPRDLTPR